MIRRRISFLAGITFIALAGLELPGAIREQHKRSLEEEATTNLRGLFTGMKAEFGEY